MKRPYIIGKKIYLRPLSPEDLNTEYLDWVNDYESNKYLFGITKPISFRELEAYYEKIVDSKNDVIFAIVDKKTDKHIGNIKLSYIDWVNRSAACGRLIGNKKYRGKGYGTEALQLVLDYAFNTLNLNRVYNGIVKDNIAAIKSCEKNGMVQEGVFKQCRFVDGKYKDAVQMGITRDRYECLRKTRKI